MLTVVDLRRILAERGIRPSRAMGQNFLVDRNLLRLIADAADLEKDDLVLEPGAGMGRLTELLASRAGTVVAVELDSGLHEIAAERLASLRNVRLLHADVLEGNKLAPVVRGALKDAMPTARRFKVVANLPYSIATALIAALLLEEDVPDEMVVTVQREVADRLCASPRSKDYGYLSVLVQALASVRRLRSIGPRAFWPQPEVESCIVKITPDPEKRRIIGDAAALLRLASGLFTYRRKRAAKALTMSGLAANRAEAEMILARAGIPTAARPEEITVEQFVRMANPPVKGG